MKLFNQFRKYMLMDEAGGDGGAGGGGGAPSLIGGDGGGGNPPAGGGAGDPAGGSNGDGNNTPPAKPAAGAGAADWRSTLPKELQEDASIKKFPSVEAMAGAYINAQKLIGADKIGVPNPKTATAEDWENVWNKLGRPALDKYDIKFGEGVTIDKDFSEDFKKNAHKAGLLPNQAQALADWFSSVNSGAEQKAAAAFKQQFDKQVGELKTEWGNAFDAKIGRVNKMLGDMGATKYFKDKGYGADVTLYKYLDSVAEKLYKEQKLVDGNAGGKQVRTPQEIKAAIGKLQADNAYMTKAHPGHAAAVQEMADLWNEYHGTVDKK